MSRSERTADGRGRRSVLGAGMAAAALIGLANIPSARADTGPFEDLFGDCGINTWTPAADTELATLSPTLAADLETSVEDFQTGFDTLFGSVSFSELAAYLDPSGFSVDGGVLIPDNALSDLAVGLDYTLFATGLGSLDSEILILLGPLFV